MTGPDPSPHPLSPDDLRRLQDNAGEAALWAGAMSDDPAAPSGVLLFGFQITDLRRYVAQLGEAEVCDDRQAEHVARALIAGYVRAALHQYDLREAARIAPDDPPPDAVR